MRNVCCKLRTPLIDSSWKLPKSMVALMDAARVFVSCI